jgi:hypothetical protein
MCPDEYRRLHAACLVMARQSKLPQVQARWLVMAQASLEREHVQQQTRMKTTRQPLQVLFFDACASKSTGDARINSRCLRSRAIPRRCSHMQ